MTDSQVIHYDFLPVTELQLLRQWLEQLELYSGTTRSGKKIDRDQKWFQESGHYFNPQWNEQYERWKAHAYPPLLLQIEQAVQQLLHPKVQLNSCLVNYYKDGMSFIPMHKDSSLSFGPAPTIVILSVGATRVMEVNTGSGALRYELPDNSIFIMSGPSVDHSIVRDPDVTEPRWSLTFRHYLAITSPLP